MDYKNTRSIHLDEVLDSLMERYAFKYVKNRRLKIGSKPCRRDVEVLHIVKRILCSSPCYVTEEHLDILENYLIRKHNEK